MPICFRYEALYSDTKQKTGMRMVKHYVILQTIQHVYVYSQVKYFRKKVKTHVKI